MKKCDYCANEITYFEQYCDNNCQADAMKFYERREKYEHIFSIINTICVFGIPIGIFVFSFARTLGMIISVPSFLALGTMLILLPFPTDNMISKYKIKKAVKITRYIGIAVIILGIILFLFMMFF